MTRAPAGPGDGHSGWLATGGASPSAGGTGARRAGAPPAGPAPVRSDRQSPMSIEIANESGIGVDEPALAALARYVLDAMRMHPLAELSVLLVDSATMADLHQ